MQDRTKGRRRWYSTVAVCTIALGAGIAIWMAIPPQITALEPKIEDLTDQTVIERGKYIAQLGDCVACHTEKGGQAMAGGLALETPMGTIWSTNITADKTTGIGNWSFGEFDRAMRKGIDADGHNLYPAMPYPSYAKITDEDMVALWAYLLNGVAPVEKTNQAAVMNFPFNLRFGLSYWNVAFADDRRFEYDQTKDEVWNRGAYLVQGLGHCGACHTPRGIGFQEVAMTDKGRNGDRFLSGAQIENWNAIELRNLWGVNDTVELLKTGRNRFAAASGAMTDVILHSTQHFTDGDLVAIATYMKSLSSDTQKHVVTEPAYGDAPETAYTTRGGLGYMQFCNDCHRADGTGVKGIFPPLAGNPAVSARDPSSLLHVTLTGWETAATNTHPRTYTMPSFARLEDEEIADILSYVRKTWGSGASEISATQVSAARKNIDPKIDKSNFETPRLSSMLKEPNDKQLVRGMRLNAETHNLLPNNVGNDLNCSSCHLNAGTVADGSPYVGVSAFFPSYAPRGGKVIDMEERINGCFRRSMNGKPLKRDGDDMKAMIAYFDWMRGETKPEDKVPGRGVGKIDPALVPDPVNGQKVYAAQCAVCHGENGEGLKDDVGRIVYPPLWGDRSFNIGAGMARTYTAAAFVQRNMPIGVHEKFPLGQGGLSDQDALDVADYFSHMPRPDFPDKVKDWPNGGKPKDARY